MHASTRHLLACTSLFLALACGVAAPGIRDVTQYQVVAWIEQGEAPLLLDVRTPEEYAAGHVPGALNIPHDQLSARLAELEDRRGQQVVVYCESGRRAAHAAETLGGAGFEELRHLTGDMAGWRHAGLPTE